MIESRGDQARVIRGSAGQSAGVIPGDPAGIDTEQQTLVGYGHRTSMAGPAPTGLAPCADPDGFAI